jgi:hypothetical protein
MSTKEAMSDQMKAQIAYTESLQPRVAELMAADPQLKPWIAYVIAQDEDSARRAREGVASGEIEPLQAVHMCGSYARFRAAVDLLPREVLNEHIIDLWRGSDPDDRDPDFLQVWKEARSLKSSYLRDGKPLPGRDGEILVYRGQDPGAPDGIAFSLDQKIAEKFASGAATRQGDREGVLLEALVSKKKVLAYITLRGESEVVIDPETLIGWREIAHWVREPK